MIHFIEYYHLEILNDHHDDFENYYGPININIDKEIKWYISDFVRSNILDNVKSEMKDAIMVDMEDTYDKRHR